MKFTSSVSSKGQVTIPQEVRKRLGLGSGDRVEFVFKNGDAVIRPYRSDENPFEKHLGILGPFPEGEEGIKAWISDMRDDDEQ